ncbi:hypothetical protein OIO90_002969 [Microbotryomycetes sp. JL221]|nr:hypothetical protein OIO90_002969 [Microbotryomycetes sp. JL221]
MTVSPLGLFKGHKSHDKHATVDQDDAEPLHLDTNTNNNVMSTQEPLQSILMDSPTVSSQGDFARTDTTSSTSTGPDHHGSRNSRFSFGHGSTASSKDSFVASVKSKAPTLPPPFERPHDLDPIGLAQLCLSTCLTIPGHSIDELQQSIIPALFHVPGYSHRVNCRECDAAGLLEIIKFLRSKFSKMRIRFRSQLMDQDGTATMKAAAVAVTYEVIAERFDDPHPKHEHIERRTQAHCISKIFEGKVDWFPGSVWASVPMLAALEKGYTDEVLEKRVVNLVAPQGTVPALVAPYEHTVDPAVPTKFKALTDSVEIAKFLDESTLSPATSHSAPKLSPATVQGSTDEQFLIQLVHKQDAPDPNFLLLSLRNDDERKAKMASLPGEFLKGRQAALEQYQKETADSNDSKLKAFYETKIKENGGLIAVYEGQADASGFYAKSQEAWSNLSKLVQLLEGKLQATYLVGDQISLADLHVGAYFARILAASGAESISEVANGQAVNKLNSNLPNGVKVGPKLDTYLKTLFARPSFKQNYAENMH